MLLALYQASSPAGDLSAGLAIIDAALGQAAEQDVDLLVFPECYLPGYNAVTKTAPEGWGQAIEQLPQLCKRHGVALAIGLPEYTDEAVYNSAYVYGQEGEALAKHRKVQVWADESKIFEPGDQLTAFDYKGVRFGLMVCYDVEFAEHVRALARNGVEAILVPTANMMPYTNVNLLTVPGKAIENGLTIVYANYCGQEGDLDYVGLSAIYGPDGFALAAKGTEPGMITADLPRNAEGEWREHDIPLSTQLQDFREAKPPS